MSAPRARKRLPIVVVLLAAALAWMPSASAYWAGGRADAIRGNDCLIGYGGIAADDVSLDFTTPTLTCQDCEWPCDHDHANGANGSCTIPIAVCTNQTGVEGCVPPSLLSKARGAYKANGKPYADLPLPAALEGSACGALVDLRVRLRKVQGVRKPAKAFVSLRARVRKDKDAGIPQRYDSDRLRIVCTPLPDGEPCHQPRVFRFVTAEPIGECGAVRSGGTGGSVRKTLHCSGLNVGGGDSTVAEGPTPGNARTDMRVGCDGTTCTVSGLTSEETGDATTCSAEGCPFGPYLPIQNAGASTCVRNTFSTAASGTLDASTGSFTGGFPLSSTVYLTANAVLPCPLCMGGTPGVAGSGTCQSAGAWTSGAGPSPDAGDACTPANADGNSYDCAPPAQTRLNPFAVNLVPITTGTAILFAHDGGFCPAQVAAGAFGCAGTGLPNAICPGGNVPPVPDYIEEIGMPAGPLPLGGPPAPATLASVFCIPRAGNFVIDAAANLPGPGAVSLPGTFELLP